MSEKGKPRYDGPRELAQSLSAFARMSAEGATWNREGLRADSEYRDLGLAAATDGRIGVKHIRAIKPFPQPTGWHWHDMTAHYVYVLRGSLTFRFAGVEGDVTLHAGDGLSQPAGVPHNVVARSDDLEVIEINEPAVYGTFDLDEPPSPWK
jgi:mannose-6-phosphate isomerase-like protein (cupin superfamily)